jgi:hypothetical protein
VIHYKCNCEYKEYKLGASLGKRGNNNNIAEKLIGYNITKLSSTPSVLVLRTFLTFLQF